MNFIPALFVFVKTWETAKMTRNKQAEQRLRKEKKLSSDPSAFMAYHVSVLLK